MEDNNNDINNNNGNKMVLIKGINTKINNSKNLIIDKNNIINKISVSNTISYNNQNQNTNGSINNANKLPKKIKIYYNNNFGKNKNICYTDRNNNKIVKTEPNIQLSQKYNIINKNETTDEIDNNINHNTKLNIIQLPSKKIKDKITKKIIFPENGAVSVGTASGKYIIKKSLIKSNSNKNKNIPNNFFPHSKDIILKKFALSKSKLKKKNETGNSVASKSSEKNNDLKKHPLKGSINQNAIKKKYIGINSAKSIFINKKNTQNNFNNINFNNSRCNESYNNNVCMTDRVVSNKNYIPGNSKIRYIYQKKIK